MSHPTTAWIAHGGRTGEDAFTAERVPVPELRPHDLLVRVRAVSVNPVDTKVLKRLGDGESKQLGYDAAGVVEAVGERASGFAVGDEVYYAGDISRPGTNAELHAVDSRIVAHKPANLDWAQAAALPLTTITAWESLFDKLRLTADSRGNLLVVGGAGGVGSVLIQLAKALTGVTVVATASRDESRAFVRELGADQVVGHRNLRDEVSAVAPEGVRWIFSSFTAGNLDAYQQLLQPFGEIVAVDDDPGPIGALKTKALSFHWEYMFARIIHETPDVAEQGRLLARTAQLVEQGRVRTTLGQRLAGLGPETLAEAHQILRSGTAVGKVSITLD
ncbi:MAG TPA: zinc-binding alcohol dehydrogenase family protein [Micropruina sp.]|nr:zinc-binding alcohol dehydrogenase family protein [Micropruina sp.]HMR22734.1 zinc-binding alcohol dehydrogenase family protein [Micropruina sp.]